MGSPLYKFHSAHVGVSFPAGKAAYSLQVSYSHGESGGAIPVLAMTEEQLSRLRNQIDQALAEGSERQHQFR